MGPPVITAIAQAQGSCHFVAYDVAGVAAQACVRARQPPPGMGTLPAGVVRACEAYGDNERADALTHLACGAASAPKAPPSGEGAAPGSRRGLRDRCRLARRRAPAPSLARSAQRWVVLQSGPDDPRCRRCCVGRPAGRGGGGGALGVRACGRVAWCGVAATCCCWAARPKLRWSAVLERWARGSGMRVVSGCLPAGCTASSVPPAWGSDDAHKPKAVPPRKSPADDEMHHRPANLRGPAAPASAAGKRPTFLQVCTTPRGGKTVQQHSWHALLPSSCCAPPPHALGGVLSPHAAATTIPATRQTVGGRGEPAGSRTPAAAGCCRLSPTSTPSPCHPPSRRCRLLRRQGAFVRGSHNTRPLLHCTTHTLPLSHLRKSPEGRGALSTRPPVCCSGAAVP